MFGKELDRAGSLAGVSRLVAYLSGLLLIGFSLLSLLAAVRVRVPALRFKANLAPLIARILGGSRRKNPLLRAALLGLCTSLLPCGWLYAFVLTAAGSGNALWGMLSMVAFWSGTVPLLFGLGVGFAPWLARARQHLPALTGAAFLAVGILTISQRLNIPALAASALHPGSPSCHPHR
jgi:hypothetical protein